MKLTLEAGRLSPQVELPLEVQSISPAGLAVLTFAGAPPGFDANALGGPSEQDEALSFVLEKDGRTVALQARLVWVEFSNDQPAGDRLELIVDTVDQPGWLEVQSALSTG
jgi:hypothetical protein